MCQQLAFELLGDEMQRARAVRRYAGRVRSFQAGLRACQALRPQRIASVRHRAMHGAHRGGAHL